MEVDHALISRSTEFGDVSINVAVKGSDADPLIVCVHGWPETWRCWHHQMDFFAARGHRAAAIDVLGYGGSSRPPEVRAYRLSELAGDVAAVVAELSSEPAVLFGHDWGAPIVHNTARLHPALIRGVAGLSVPYRPATVGDPMELWRALYQESYFYMLYFDKVGEPEAEFEADIARAMRMTYYAASASAPLEMWMNKAPDARFLDGLVDPDPLPEWLDLDAFEGTVSAHGSPGADGVAGMHGAFNRYRAQRFDGDDIEGVGDPLIAQPTCFIGGEADMVRSFVPGMDMFANPGEFMSDYRGTTLIEGAGHWVNQEKPDETNAALEKFIDGL